MKTLTFNEVKILNSIEENGRYSVEELCKELSIPASEIIQTIKSLEEEGIILKYKTLINWEKIESSSVTSLVHVSVLPKEGAGYDNVAKQISKLDEVKTCFLVSGSFDLLVEVKGKSLQDIAFFIADKLATIPRVTHTKTNFLLKKYKQSGDLLMSNKTHRHPLTI